MIRSSRPLRGSNLAEFFPVSMEFATSFDEHTLLPGVREKVRSPSGILTGTSRASQFLRLTSARGCVGAMLALRRSTPVRSVITSLSSWTGNSDRPASSLRNRRCSLDAPVSTKAPPQTRSST